MSDIKQEVSNVREEFKGLKELMKDELAGKKIPDGLHLEIDNIESKLDDLEDGHYIDEKSAIRTLQIVENKIEGMKLAIEGKSEVE